MNHKIQGLVTDVQRFSLHDGPGIRTTVFFKGCPLRCFWCHNPETWSVKPQILYHGERCTCCGACSEVCPGVMHLMQGGEREFRHEYCNKTEECIAACNYGGLELTGKWWNPEKLFFELTKDITYYKKSGGGITLSGGEPLLQWKFCSVLLKMCKDAGLHTAIETSGYWEWNHFSSLLPFLDMVIMDIKLMDDGLHKKATGMSNQLILENALRLEETGIPILIRTPVVPGVNDNEEAITLIAEFIKPFRHLMYYELMQFHSMAKKQISKPWTKLQGFRTFKAGRCQDAGLGPMCRLYETCGCENRLKSHLI